MQGAHLINRPIIPHPTLSPPGEEELAVVGVVAEEGGVPAAGHQQAVADHEAGDVVGVTLFREES